MTSSDSKHWAKEYVLDPLNGPDPSQETGLNSSFRPDRTDSKTAETKSTPIASVREQTTGGSSSTNPFRDRASSGTNPFRDRASSGAKSGAAAHSRAASNASNGSRSRPISGYRAEAFPDLDGVPRRRSGEAARSSGEHGKANRSRRSSSLRERYPGDPSVHPLDQITREAKLANRSPHLKKRHLSGADSIDRLDDGGIGAQYHHEGPYDAASLARNNSYESAPIAALQHTNAEALKATPADKIKDSLNDHRPLDGTAIFPPGVPDPLGHQYNYEEGTDMMREGRPEGGAYKRYEGVEYLPEDLKGKGEPSYSLEKAEKEKKIARKPVDSSGAIELVERPRGSTKGSPSSESGRRRGESAGSRISGEIKRRVGSLRRKDN